ncbi:hypothetical protein F8M41_012849 [Gigaspora margarita]|uniref:Uncharacterized protein n=1 Tax=Gigaspora margarita TaxID=4874 RepID=A0A8H4ASQ8_GIGMA|nr:hypothetical protein F8M41_012849 [Gigaspora margarita]
MMMLEGQPIDKPSSISSIETNNAIYIDSPSPDASIDQIGLEDEEFIIDDFNFPASSSTTPLNSPPSNFKSINLSTKLNKRSINLLDSILDNPSKKSRDYSESVARGYLCLAKLREWINDDGSYFPISVINLCNYLRVKMITNNAKSLDWNVNALCKYQKNVLNIQNWNDVRFHHDVKDLMNQIREKKIKDDNIKKEDDINTNIEKMKGKDATSSSESSSSPSPTPSLIDNRKKRHLTRSNSVVYNDVNTNSESMKEKDATSSSELSSSPSPTPSLSDNRKKRRLTRSNNEESEISQTISSANSDSSQTTISEESMISLISTHDVVNVSTISIDHHPQLLTLSPKGIDEQKEIIQEDVNEPKSFKSRYERSLSILKSLYANHCDFHPGGCVLLPDDHHFVLNDSLYRHWALLCASGDDIVETDLPVADELDEFSKSHAIKV